jgi:DNA-binding transcriptional MocR family regulator
MPTRMVGVHHLLDLLEGWRDDGGATYTALADRIRLLIIDGRITPGTRIPSERELAARLSVSRTTVNSAFAALRSSGHLTSRQGSGSIATVPGRPGDLPIPSPSDQLDLSRATSASVPGVHAATVRAVERLPSRLLTDGYELTGLPELLQGLADRYLMRGLDARPDQIAVTSGAQSAISLIARTLVARGDRVVVEAPGYPHALNALRGAGARLLPLAVDPDDGWDVDGFEELVRRSLPSAVFLMPDFQNPTSRSMTLEARARIVRVAEDHGVLIVANETTAELDIDRGEVLPPLAAFASRPASVVSIGSASKTIWGGLRIGWIHSSTSVIDRLVAARLANDLGASVIDQLVVSEMLGELDRVLEYRRDLHRQSRDTLEAGLRAHLPGWRLPRTDGGVAAWVQLDGPHSSALTIAARDRGLLIGAGPWFGLEGEFERFIRIPITATPDAIERAVQILADAWASLPGTRDERTAAPL